MAAPQPWSAPPAGPQPQPGWSPEQPGSGAPPQSWSPTPGQPPPHGAPPAPGAAQAWSAPTDAPSRSGGATPLAGVLGIIAGILALVSPFLAWFSINGVAGGDLSYSMWKILTGGDDVPLDSPDAIFVLVAGLIAVVLGVLILKTRSKALSGLLLVAGLVVIAVAVRDWMSISDLAKDLPTTVTLDGGIGLYLAYAGGGLAALAGLLGLIVGKKT